MPDGSIYTVRQAAVADARAIGHALASRWDQPHKLGHHTAWVQRLLQGIRDHPDHRLLLVAERRGAVIGHARASWFEPPPDAPPDTAPPGWYLLGIWVHPAVRRKGIGAELTRARMAWLAERTDVVWYFRNVDNEASAALHAPYGFSPVTTAFTFPGTRDPSVPMVLLRATLNP